MTDVARRSDPEECSHLWELVLNTTGRRVELWCPRCSSTDKDIWPPGGIADLVEYKIEATGVYVSRADHTAKHLTSIPVSLQVRQSTVIDRRTGSLETDTRVAVTPRTLKE